MPNKLHAALLKHNQQIPRYTSYPTAPHFKNNIGEKEVSNWLSAIPKENTLSLYFHIPFCKNMCWYCGCNTKATRQYQPVSEYLSYLKKEVSLVASKLKTSKSVTHIHFGGGSPSYISPNDFRDFMTHVRSCFDILDSAEIAIELDPREITETKVAAYAHQGVNRASLGVQDFHAPVQEAINRIQPFRTVFHTVELLRSYGIEAVSFDLLYGLPKQTREMVEENVRFAALMNPSRISLFGYAHVPWMKKHMKLIQENSLPDSLERLEQFDTARAALKQEGYIEIGLDHFAKPNDSMAKAYEQHELHRNFQGYTTDMATTLIGFGASAISAYTEGYSQNTPDTHAYYKALDDDKIPTIKGLKLNSEDLLRRRIIEHIMCYKGIDLSVIAASEHIDINTFANEHEKLLELEKDGLVEITGTRVEVNPNAVQATRLAAAAFDTYLAPTAQKHAQVT
tara:strand:+ start:319 stop:1677 length:1359 start_codon:yes stop_codon:yes gene_type:complete